MIKVLGGIGCFYLACKLQHFGKNESKELNSDNFSLLLETFQQKSKSVSNRIFIR